MHYHCVKMLWERVSTERELVVAVIHEVTDYYLFLLMNMWFWDFYKSWGVTYVLDLRIGMMPRTMLYKIWNRIITSLFWIYLHYEYHNCKGLLEHILPLTICIRSAVPPTAIEFRLLYVQILATGNLYCNFDKLCC